MLTARRSINLLLLEWSNQGLNLWTVEERELTLTADDGEYTLDADIVDLIEHVIEMPDTTPAVRYALTRVSVSTHANRTNPELSQRPTQIYVDRGRAAPVIHLWPIPDDAYVLHYWVMRRMDEAGAYTNTADVPFRFLPAFIAGMAFKIAEKKRQDDPALIQRLEAQYATQWRLAAGEDRDRSTLRVVPRRARV